MGDLADEGRQGKALRRLSRLKLLVPFRVAHPACNFRCLPSHAAGRESNRLREATCFNFSPQRGMRKCGELQYLGFAKVSLDLDSHHMHPTSQESRTAARGRAFPATTTNKARAAMIPRAVSALRIVAPLLAGRGGLADELFGVHECISQSSFCPWLGVSTRGRLGQFQLPPPRMPTRCQPLARRLAPASLARM